MRRGQVIRVLGPIDLLTPDGVRSVGSRQARRLLGVLVVAAGRAVSTDQVRYALWGEQPPPSADNTLQTYISRLRRLLGSGAIRRADHSYRLVVGRDQIDAVQFEDLLIEAGEHRDDPARSAEVCRAALALWRGEPFGDFVDDEPFHLESIRLDQLRLAGMELALESELALGHHEIVVAELESVVQEYPYRERLWHLLIDALLKDERRIEALQACERLRDTLGEAGLDIGDEVRALEHRILHEPAGDR